jgi:hypothetical protein
MFYGRRYGDELDARKEVFEKSPTFCMVVEMPEYGF